jgi:uncharacterized protein (TIGR02270 family)
MNTAANYQSQASSAYRGIYDQFVDNASFLWILRSIAVDQPHYFCDEIQDLENRIQAQLDGLITNIDQAWENCEKALEYQEPGEVFTAAVTAFRSHDMNKIQQTVEIGLSNEQAFKGLVSALGWLPGKLVHGWIKKFFTSKNLDHKYLAVAACSVRRENPEAYLNRILEREDCRAHIPLYSRCLRLIGELRRLDLMPYLVQASKHEEDSVKFWASWSSVLLGNHAHVTGLETYILKKGPFQNRAINLAFRILPVDKARALISKLAEQDGQTRNVIKASGILGDPQAINWLVEKMQDRQVARLAGESFSLITGIDLERRELVDEQKQVSENIEEDLPEDEDVALDEDENLPWPDYQKIKKFWMNHGRHFIAGQRYVLGKPVSTEWLKNKLGIVTQRQRHAIALELALLGESPLLNTHAKISA